MNTSANRKRIIEKKAATLRKEFGFNNTEPIHLKGMLLKQGIITLFRPMSESFSGMAIKVEEEGEIHRFIMVNSNKSIGHQNFTICHELYHLYIQQKFESKICQTGLFNKKDFEEYSADIFASCFLLPEDGLLDVIPESEIIDGNISISTILKIENLYGCSRKALLIRLRNLSLISEVLVGSYSLNIKTTAASYGYAPYLYEKTPDNAVGGDYGELAHLLYDNEIISETHYYSLMSALGVSIEAIEMQNEDEIS